MLALHIVQLLPLCGCLIVLDSGYEFLEMMLGIVDVHFGGLGLNLWIRDNYHDVGIGCEGIDHSTKTGVTHFHPLELGLCLATTQLELFHNVANLFIPMRIKMHVTFAIPGHLIVINRTGRLCRIF